MADPARRRATYQDVIDAPPNMVAEVLFGTLYTNARPGAPHARTASVLGMNLGGPFDRGCGGPGGWVLLDEPEIHLHLGADIVVPDLAGWLKDRFERPSTAYFTAHPDFVCEVLSRSTEKIERADKMTIYAREVGGTRGSSIPSHGRSRRTGSGEAIGPASACLATMREFAPSRSTRSSWSSPRSGSPSLEARSPVLRRPELTAWVALPAAIG